MSGIREASVGSVERTVGRLPDLAHAALAEEGGDVVVPEAGAGAEWHGGLERPLYRRRGGLRASRRRRHPAQRSTAFALNQL